VKKHFEETKRFPRLTLTTLLVATAVLAIAAVTVVSRQRSRTSVPKGIERNNQVAKSPEVNPDPSPAMVTVNVAGQDVQVNGQTGEIKPLTQEEARKLAAGLKQMVNQSTEGLVQVRHTDGSVSMDMEGRFQNVTVVRVNKDGSISQSCVDNPQAAGAFFGIDPKLIENQSSSRAVVNQRSRKIVNKQQ
jgi:hypothetical protein